MPKAKTFEFSLLRRAIRPHHVALLILCSAMCGGAVAAASDEAAASNASSATMESAIEAARVRKAQELERQLRQLLGKPDVAPALNKAPTNVEERPQLWALSGIGSRLRAEVRFRGTMIMVDSSTTGAQFIGPWKVKSLNSVALVLTRASSGKKLSTLVLHPPVRGEQLDGMVVDSLGEMPNSRPINLELLNGSSQRAANLPFDTAAGNPHASKQIP